MRNAERMMEGREKSSRSKGCAVYGGNHVNAEESVCLCVRKRLHEALRICVAFATRVGRHWEATDTIWYLVCLQLLLAAPHPGHFRRRVDHGGHAVVVHVHRHAWDACRRLRHACLRHGHVAGIYTINDTISLNPISDSTIPPQLPYPKLENILWQSIVNMNFVAFPSDLLHSSIRWKFSGGVKDNQAKA